jgi:hypothetical protein
MADMQEGRALLKGEPDAGTAASAATSTGQDDGQRPAALEVEGMGAQSPQTMAPPTSSELVGGPHPRPPAATRSGNEISQSNPIDGTNDEEPGSSDRAPESQVGGRQGMDSSNGSSTSRPVSGGARLAIRDAGPEQVLRADVGAPVTPTVESGRTPGDGDGGGGAATASSAAPPMHSRPASRQAPAGGLSGSSGSSSNSTAPPPQNSGSAAGNGSAAGSGASGQPDFKVCQNHGATP